MDIGQCLVPSSYFSRSLATPLFDFTGNSLCVSSLGLVPIRRRFYEISSTHFFGKVVIKKGRFGFMDKQKFVSRMSRVLWRQCVFAVTGFKAFEAIVFHWKDLFFWTFEVDFAQEAMGECTFSVVKNSIVKGCLRP